MYMYVLCSIIAEMWRVLRIYAYENSHSDINILQWQMPARILNWYVPAVDVYTLFTSVKWTVNY